MNSTTASNQHTQNKNSTRTFYAIHVLKKRGKTQKNFVNLSLTLIKALVMKNATSALQIASNCWNKRKYIHIYSRCREWCRESMCQIK